MHSPCNVAILTTVQLQCHCNVLESLDLCTQCWCFIAGSIVAASSTTTTTAPAASAHIISRVDGRRAERRKIELALLSAYLGQIVRPRQVRRQIVEEALFRVVLLIFCRRDQWLLINSLLEFCKTLLEVKVAFWLLRLRHLRFAWLALLLRRYSLWLPCCVARLAIGSLLPWLLLRLSSRHCAWNAQNRLRFLYFDIACFQLAHLWDHVRHFCRLLSISTPHRSCGCWPLNRHCWCHWLCRWLTALMHLFNRLSHRVLYWPILARWLCRWGVHLLQRNRLVNTGKAQCSVQAVNRHSQVQKNAIFDLIQSKIAGIARFGLCPEHVMKGLWWRRSVSIRLWRLVSLAESEGRQRK